MRYNLHVMWKFFSALRLILECGEVRQGKLKGATPRHWGPGEKDDNAD